MSARRCVDDFRPQAGLPGWIEVSPQKRTVANQPRRTRRRFSMFQSSHCQANRADAIINLIYRLSQSFSLTQPQLRSARKRRPPGRPWRAASCQLGDIRSVPGPLLQTVMGCLNCCWWCVVRERPDNFQSNPHEVATAGKELTAYDMLQRTVMERALRDILVSSAASLQITGLEECRATLPTLIASCAANVRLWHAQISSSTIALGLFRGKLMAQRKIEPGTLHLSDCIQPFCRRRLALSSEYSSLDCYI